MKYISVLLLSMILAGTFPMIICAQKVSDKLKPQWYAKGKPKEANNTYTYEIVHGVGNTIDDARKNAVVQLIVQAAHRRGVEVSVSEASQLYSEVSAGSMVEKDVFSQNVKMDKGDFDISFYKVDEYWETRAGGSVDCSVLFAVSNRAGKADYAGVHTTTKYGARGLVRSIIPGVGQIYKGSKAKGWSILAGEVVCAGAIIVCESQRASYVKKIKEQPKHIKTYSTKADNWENGRNIAIGAAAALYAYNLIDALVAPGARRVVAKKQRNYLSMQPHFSDGCNGISLAFNF